MIKSHEWTDEEFAQYHLQLKSNMKEHEMNKPKRKEVEIITIESLVKINENFYLDYNNGSIRKSYFYSQYQFFKDKIFSVMNIYGSSDGDAYYEICYVELGVIFTVPENQIDLVEE
jgi:hypothetical protein